MKVKADEGRLGVGLLARVQSSKYHGKSKDLRVHLSWGEDWDQMMALQVKGLAG